MNLQNDALKLPEDLKFCHREVDEHIQDLIQDLNNDQLQIRKKNKNFN